MLNPTWSLEVFAAKERCREALLEKLASIAPTGRKCPCLKVHRHTHRALVAITIAPDRPSTAGSRGSVSE